MQQEYYLGDWDKIEDTTYFTNLYNLKIWKPTLRELLVFKSLYYAVTQEKIVELINEQPIPLIFFKSLLEFDGTNMVSLLSFDSKSMMQLLSDKFSKYFSSTYPIFYRNKFNKGTEKKLKYYYRNAID